MINRIILPKNSIIIERDVPAVNKTGLIVEMNPPKPNTGVIIYTCKELKDLILNKITFRENFIEEVNVEGRMMVFMRDFDQSTYYALRD